MISSTITLKGQVTIPKKIRDEFGLKPHDKVVFVRRGDALVLKPVKDIFSVMGSVKPHHETDFRKIRKETQRIIAEKIAHE